MSAARQAGSSTDFTIPDVGGLSLADAALAYANAGMHILPTSVWDIKNPGSIVQDRWHEKASCDPAQIDSWWSSSQVGGIAFHPGPSGIVVFDLDEDCDDKPDDMPGDIWDALQTGLIHQTRKSGVGKDARAHYMFACEPSEFGCSAGAFNQWGEVRCQGGVVILAPTPHPDADTKDGEYHWATSGEISPLPDVLREMLTAPGKTVAPKTPKELDAFLEKHTESRNQDGLKPIISTFYDKTNAGYKRHDALKEVLPWAFREVIIGEYAAQFAYDALQFAFFRVKPEARTTGEFDRFAKWAAAQAELADPDETRRRIERYKSKSQAEPDTEFAANEESFPLTTCLADVEPRKVEWLWKTWLPLGKLSLFVNNEKSHGARKVAARPRRRIRCRQIDYYSQLGIDRFDW